MSRKDCLIGSTGFIGGNLLRQASFADAYRSSNIHEIRGRSYDLVVCAAPSAAKWLANKNPEQDRSAIDGMLGHLSQVKASEAVLISTVDVYPVTQGVDESFDCGSLPNHAYGTNRLYLEGRLRQLFPQLQVVRLPGMFGMGLKKNVIYDLINDNCLSAINPNSVFQYYDVSRLWADIGIVRQHRLSLVNMATEPITTQTVIDHLFPGKRVGDQAGASAAYDLHTRHAEIFGGKSPYRFSSDQVLELLGKYVSSTRAAGAA